MLWLLGSRPYKLIIRVIIFKLTQHIRQWYIKVTDGRPDRQTDGRLTYAATYETETRSMGFFLRRTSCMEHSSNVVAANFWHRNF